MEPEKIQLGTPDVHYGTIMDIKAILNLDTLKMTLEL